MGSPDAEIAPAPVAAMVYAEETQAGRAARELERCAVDLGLDRDAFATVVCEPDGGYRLTTSAQPMAPGQWSRFWGTLFVAIANRDFAAGLDAGFRDRLEGALRPGTSALLFAVDSVLRPRLLRTLSPYGGDFLSCEDATSPDSSARSIASVREETPNLR